MLEVADNTSKPITKKTREMADMYFVQGMTQAEIAAHFGITAQAVSKHLNNEAVLNEYDTRRSAHALRAKIRLAAAAERAVEVQMGYLNKELPINLEYLRQNAARDILDRAGVRTEPVNEDKAITVVFAVEPGMPARNKDDE